MKTRLLLMLSLFIGLIAYGQTIPAGSIDNTFNTVGTGFNSGVTSLATQSDGKILVGGYFTSYNGTPRYKIARINADGSLDTSFQFSNEITGEGVSQVDISAIKILSNGKILIGFQVLTNSSSTHTNTYVYKLNSNGTIDSSFTSVPFVDENGNSSEIKSIEVLSNGNIIVGGSFSKVSEQVSYNMVLLNANGTILTAFNSYLTSITRDSIFEYVNSIKIQTDGKILVGGIVYLRSSDTYTRLIRLNINGTIDSAFNSNLYANCIAIQNDGQIVVGNSSEIYRLNTDGAIDSSFSSIKTDNIVEDLTIDSNGKIVIVGRFTKVANISRNKIARLNSDGTLDTTFDIGTGASGQYRYIYGISIQSDGKIIIGGNFISFNSDENQRYISRLFNEETERVTNVPDNNFEQALIDLGYDDVLDGSVNTANINSITSIELNGKNISNLTGIEDFTSLTQLYVGNNLLTSLDVSKNINLINLNCKENSLSELDVTKNIKLETLLCNDNSLSSLNLENNIDLYQIWCFNNVIESLDLSNNLVLTKLACNDNSLTSLNIKNGNNINLSELYVSNNPNLNCIQVDDENHSTTNWTYVTSARYSEDCSIAVVLIPDTVFEQKLIDAGFDTNGLNGNILQSEAEAITQLNFRNDFNPDTSLIIKEATGIESMPNLTSLVLGNHALTSIDVTNNPKLETLDLFYSNISVIDLSNNNLIKRLDLAHNNLTEINVTNLTQLESLFLNNNNTIELIDLSNNTLLTTAWLSYNNFSTIDVSNNNLLVTLRLSGNDLSQIDISNLGELDRFDIQQNNISSLDVSNNTKLRYLDFKYNKVSSIDVSGNLELIEFSAFDNLLTSEIDLSLHKKLTKVILGTNQLTKINLNNGANTNLTAIDFRSNPNLSCIQVDDVSYATSNFTNIDNSSLYSTDCFTPKVTISDTNFEQALIDLGWDTKGLLDGTITESDAQKIDTLRIPNPINNSLLPNVNAKISDLTGLESMSNLVYLDASDNELTAVNTANNPNLKNLGLGLNLLTTLDVSNNSNLKQLFAYNNNLTSIIFGTQTSLEYLYIGNNQLTNVDLSSMTSLKRALAENNMLTAMDVSNSPNLEWYTIFDNQVTSVDFSNNPKITSIWMYNNQITSLDVTNLTELTSLRASSNQINNINVTSNVKLKTFEMDGNGLTALDLTNNPLLEYLFVGNNPQIGNIDTSIFTNLIKIGIDNIGATNLDLTNSPNLTELFSSNNSLASLDLSNNPLLTRLWLNNNTNLSGLSVSNMTVLEEFAANNTKTNIIDVGVNTELKILELGNTGLSTIDLTKNTKLENLSLYDNNMTDIDLSQNLLLKKLDINQVKKVGDLDLSNHNQLEDVVINNTLLSSLNLNNGSNTLISRIEIKNNTNLTCIQVDDVEYSTINFTNVDNTSVFSTSCFSTPVVVIPDTNFEQALIDLGKDSNGLNGNILLSEAQAIDSLRISDPINNALLPNVSAKLTDLTGIESMINLTFLNATTNEVSNLDLSQNTNLTELYADNNSISTITFSDSNLIESINLRNNPIAAIDVTSFNNLKNLDLSYSNISTIDVTQNLNLEAIWIGGTQITSLDVTQNINLLALGIFENGLSVIDLSNNISLVNLQINDNNFTAFDTSIFPNLKYFIAHNNQLTSIDFSANTLLEVAQVQSNQLTFIDVTNNTELVSFWVFKNQLTTLDVTNNIKLDYLGAFENQLTSIDVSKNTALTTLSVRNNQLTTLDVSNNINLTGLWFLDNKITEIDVSNNTLLEGLGLESNLIKELDLSNNVNLKRVYLNDGVLEKINLKNGNNTLITEINFNNNPNLNCIEVDDVTYATTNFTNIENASVFNLDCGFQTEETVVIPDTNFEQALIDLGKDTNGLNGNILLSDAQAIDSLKISNPINNVLLPNVSAKITDLTGIESMSSLVYLEAYLNEISSIDLSENIELSYLSISYNKLTAINLSSNLKINTLDLSENQLTTIDLTNNILLEKLWLPVNEITSLDLSKNTSLSYLNAGETLIETIDLTKNTLLKEFYLFSSKLTSLNLQENENLETFVLTGNSFITTLDLSKNNNLTNITIVRNTGLAEINLQNTNNNKVAEVYLGDNPKLTCVQVDDVSYSTENWASINNTSVYSVNCFTNTAPTVSLVTFSGTLTEAEVLTASYEYSDFDADVEAGSTYKWYVSEDLQGTNKITITDAITQSYTLTTEDVGKYISFEVTPNDGTEFGESVESELQGPIEAVFVNTAPTVSSVTFSGTLTEAEVLTASYEYSDFDADVEAGSTYKWYVSEDLQGTNKIAITDAITQSYTLTTEDVGKYISFEVTPNDGTEFGESVESELQGPIEAVFVNTAPTVSSVTFSGTLTEAEVLTASYEYSDFDADLETGSTYKWYVSEDLQGTNKIAITDAITQSYTLTTEDVGKYISFEVTPNDGTEFGESVESELQGPIEAVFVNTAPTVSSVTFSGTLTEAEVLTASYEYSDFDADLETGSTYKWYVSEDLQGTNKIAITDAITQSYTLTTEDVGKYISFEVTPNDGTEFGESVESELQGPIEAIWVNTAPTVTNVQISGTLTEAEVLTASYEYSDFDADVEAGSTYKWYVSEDATGTNKIAITDAITQTYTLTTEDVGKYISFEVTPNDGTEFGESVESELQGPIEAIWVNTAPTVTNVQISGTLTEAEVLTASYEYSDFDADVEAGSTYKWYVSEDATGTNKIAITDAITQTYTLTTEDVGKYISFEVTPNDGTEFGTSVESELQGPVEALEVLLILDANFEQALIDLGHDTNGLNGNILKSEAEVVTFLNVESKNISDLKGIQGFTALETLGCSLNNITSIDLSNNKAIKVLFIGDNQLTSLDVSMLIDLEQLVVDRNKITDIDVSKNLALNALSLSGNLLTSLDVSSNVLLEDYLWSNDNLLTALDLSKNPRLKIIHAENNNLSSLNIKSSGNNNITEFYATGNPNLSCIQVDEVVYAETTFVNIDSQTNFSEDCDLFLNPVVYIPDANMKVALVADAFINTNGDDEIQVSEAEAITGEIDKGENLGISVLTGIEAFINITGLNVKNNNLSSVDLSKNKKLIWLEIGGNNLTSLNVDSLTVLTRLVAKNNNITGIKLTNNTDLVELDASNNDIVNFDINQNSKITKLILNDNNLERVVLQNGNNTSISDISLLNNPNLECVTVDDVDYSNTNWANKDAQTNYNIDCNSVWEIYTEDEELDSALISIPGLDDDGDGEITYEEAQSFTGNLDLSGQNITDATGLEAFSNAESIDVSGNNITDISNLLDNTSVVVVSKTTGEKKTFTRNNAEGIKKLNVSNNLLEEVDVSKVTSITELILANNKLIYLNLNNNSNTTLIKVDVTGNPDLSCIQVDDVDIANNNADWKKDAIASYNTFCSKTVLNIESYLTESISMYPNPTTTNIQITITNDIMLRTIEIYNSIGKKVIESNKSLIDLKSLANGIYLVRVITDKGFINKKLIKK
ncbi:T9SS type A sorting domain-containing protein [Polaribacter ponticola]|uniref:T9SS type A sorting domain-containing protein n=1 Tax=Polaribacter ponticola TaxID=2978475 RepID=A0ABT5S737_9FLAO|nr:T9SS type A sorting domain-containing protein [Polaribacter sp. MSW5]MDD7913916.1 T9SS type A sorting domain-containing protein [Polaribacter sp. MSW5]